MRRTIEILGSPDADTDVLRRVGLRSKRAPHLVACASQYRLFVEERFAETWRIAALKPLKLDTQGIPSTFRFIGFLTKDKKSTMASLFSYQAMMDRLDHNYGPTLYDPLKLVLDHYEDERRRRDRGEVAASARSDSVGDSLSCEASARRGPV